MKTKFFTGSAALLTTALSFAQVCTDIDALGSSSNWYSIGLTESNAIAVDNDLNTVIFVHRNNASIYGGHSGNLRYDISTDNGITWTSDLGPLNPASVNGTNAARYPNIAFYNPTGNTNPNNAYLSYYAPTVAATWNGHVSGVRKLDGTGNTESYNQTGATQTLIPRSVCKGVNGTLWAVDAVYNGTTTTGYRILKGVWNGTSDYVWTVNTTLTPTFNTAFDGANHSTDFAIGFDPSGQVGWVSILTDISVGASNYSFNPVFYHTENAGLTWSAPEQVDLGQFSCISSIITPGNFPSAAFDLDLTVDMNGNPHAVMCVGNNPSSYSIFYTEAHNMYDITLENGLWNALNLGAVNAGRQTFGTDPNFLTMDMNPHASRTDDGSKVFFTWAGSDAVPVANAPNLYGIGYDVATRNLTPMRDLSSCNPSTSGKMLFPKLSETVLNVNGGWELPIIYGDPADINNTLMPLNYQFLDSLIFTQAEFQLQQCSPFVTFANPDTVVICEGAAATLSVTSTHDQYLWDNGQTTPTIAITFAGWNYVSVRSDCCIGRDSIFVAVDSLVMASFSSTTNTLSADFTNASAGLPTSYLWDFGDGNTSTLDNPSHTYDFPGDYTVCLIASDACGEDTLCELVSVSCAAIPSPGFSSVNGSAGLVAFTNTTTPIADQYFWDFGDGNSSSLENPSHTYLASGTFNVCLISQDTCGTDTLCTMITVDIFADINELVGMDIQIYPNPAQDVIFVEGTGLTNQEWELKLVNTLGEVVWTEKVIGDVLNETIPIKGLAASVYYLEIRSDEKAGRYMVVKQ